MQTPKLVAPLCNPFPARRAVLPEPACVHDVPHWLGGEGAGKDGQSPREEGAHVAHDCWGGSSLKLLYGRVEPFRAYSRRFSGEASHAEMHQGWIWEHGFESSDVSVTLNVNNTKQLTKRSSRESYLLKGKISFPLQSQDVVRLFPPCCCWLRDILLKCCFQGSCYPAPHQTLRNHHQTAIAHAAKYKPGRCLLGHLHSNTTCVPLQVRNPPPVKPLFHLPA